MRTQLLSMLGLGLVALLVGCMDERDVGSDEADCCVGEVDAGGDSMAGPLFIKTPTLYAGTTAAPGHLDLVTVPGPEAILIETLHYCVEAVLLETDEGKIQVILTPPYPDDVPLVLREILVAANNPAVTGVAAQGTVRLDIVLPEDWVLTVIGGVRLSPGGAWANIGFVAAGGELG